MQAHNNNIQEFLGTPKTVFVVPVYQRNYDWLDENCKRLFDDIIRITETGREHFLGTICFKTSSSHERSVVDGQQRLTSISLLLRAMYEFDTDEDNRQEIRDSYLYNKGRGIDTDFLRYKLHLNKRDDAVYHAILENPKDGPKEKLPPEWKKSRIYRNYLLFYDLIADYTGNGGSVSDILEALRSLTIIELEIRQENPQEIFESLNSTGLDLTNTDLLRNWLLMQFPYEIQTSLCEEYWEQIEYLVGSEHMETFFTDRLIFRRRNNRIRMNGADKLITERNLYTVYKEHFTSLPGTDSLAKTTGFFSDLKTCAEIYREFLFSDDINLDREPPLRKKLYFLLSVIESSQSRSLLLYLFDLRRRGLITDVMLDTAVSGIVSLAFRAKVCGKRGVTRQFVGNVMQRLDGIRDYAGFTDFFWQAITFGKGSCAFPSDEEFRDALVNKDLYLLLRSKGTKYLLYTLEANSPHSMGLAPFTSDTIQIEHIMPQTLSGEWKDYLTKSTPERYDSSLHRLGNLALTDYNGELSNKTFDEKKRIFKDSKYFYTSRICQYDKWQAEEINDRSERLADEALKVWPLPERYRPANTKAAPASLHTLDEDNGQYAFTKPAMLLIGSREYRVSSWSEFLPIFCRQLAEEDPDALEQLAKRGRIPALVLERNGTDYANNKFFTSVGGNVYVRLFMSSANILETMLRIAKAYDAIAGTEYADSVLFSLKS